MFRIQNLGEGEGDHIRVARRPAHDLASPAPARGFGVWHLGFGLWALEFGVWAVGFEVWGLGFRGQGLGVQGFGFMISGFGVRDLPGGRFAGLRASSTRTLNP